MKYNLLQLSQLILSSMDGDEINSISDSVESQQVAKIIRTVYFDIVTRGNLPEHYSLSTMDASGDTTKPVLMTIPSNVAEVLWLKYDNASTTDTDIQMRPVAYQSLEDFLARMHMLNASDTNIDTFTHTVGTDSYTFLYFTNKHPQYFTTFDDHTLIFDSFDSTVDTTLQKSKTLAYCKLVIPFTMSDTFEPNLDEQQFALLVNECKALAWAELKQTQHAKAEQNAKRGWTTLQNTKFNTQHPSFFDQLPNYGRK